MSGLANRRTVLGAIGVGAVGGIAVMQDDESDDESNDGEENGSNTDLAVTKVTTADYHRGEAGDYVEQSEFERGNGFQAVASVDGMLHDGEMNIAIAIYIVFGGSETVYVHQNTDSARGADFDNWEFWTDMIPTYDWGVGEYEAIATCTDLLEGVSDTRTATFTIT